MPGVDATRAMVMGAGFDWQCNLQSKETQDAQGVSKCPQVKPVAFTIWPKIQPILQAFCAKPSAVCFVRQFPLNFQTHVYFQGNVIHMFLIHLHLNHHNAVLLNYLMSKKPMRPFTSPFKGFSFEPASHGFPVQNVN